jgi:hypothetical protein
MKKPQGYGIYRETANMSEIPLMSFGGNCTEISSVFGPLFFSLFGKDLLNLDVGIDPAFQRPKLNI